MAKIFKYLVKTVGRKATMEFFRAVRLDIDARFCYALMLALLPSTANTLTHFRYRQRG